MKKFEKKQSAKKSLSLILSLIGVSFIFFDTLVFGFLFNKRSIFGLKIFNLFNLKNENFSFLMTPLESFNVALFRSSAIIPGIKITSHVDVFFVNLLIGSTIMLSSLIAFQFITLPRFKNPFAHAIFGGALGIFLPCNGISGWIVACAMFLRGGSNVMSLSLGVASSSLSLWSFAYLLIYSKYIVFAKALFVMSFVLIAPVFVILKYKDDYVKKSYKTMSCALMDNFGALSLLQTATKSFLFLFIPTLIMLLGGLVMGPILEKLFTMHVNMSEIFGLSILSLISQFDIINGGVMYSLPKIDYALNICNMSVGSVMLNSQGFSAFSFAVIWKTFSPKSAWFVFVYFVLTSIFISIASFF